jgi:hypothetical protein
MDILEILSTYGVVAYAIAIFFGGRWGLKYFSYFQQTKYNFLVFATFFALVFIVGEYLAGTFKPIDFARYLITYAIVTSCYEFVVDLFPFLRPKTKNKNNDNGN